MIKFREYEQIRRKKDVIVELAYLIETTEEDATDCYHYLEQNEEELFNEIIDSLKKLGSRFTNHLFSNPAPSRMPDNTTSKHLGNVMKGAWNTTKTGVGNAASYVNSKATDAADGFGKWANRRVAGAGRGIESIGNRLNSAGGLKDRIAQVWNPNAKARRTGALGADRQNDAMHAKTPQLQKQADKLRNFINKYYPDKKKFGDFDAPTEKLLKDPQAGPLIQRFQSYVKDNKYTGPNYKFAGDPINRAQAAKEKEGQYIDKIKGNEFGAMSRNMERMGMTTPKPEPRKKKIRSKSADETPSTTTEPSVTRKSSEEAPKTLAAKELPPIPVKDVLRPSLFDNWGDSEDVKPIAKAHSKSPSLWPK